MIEIDISADSEEEAIAEVMHQLGVNRDALEITVMSSSHDDILPGAEPLPGVTVRIRIKEDLLINEAKSHLVKILELLGVPGPIEVFKRRGGTVLNICAGDAGSLVIGRNGQNLESLQILINRMVVHGARELMPIYVDCEGYFEKRLSRLEMQASKAAKRAIRQGVEVPLSPMTPFERKMIHNALKEVRGIHTLSRGEGLERHIVIVPDENQQSVQDRRTLKPHRRAQWEDPPVQPMREEHNTGFGDGPPLESESSYPA